jgi:hypothetical protein
MSIDNIARIKSSDTLGSIVPYELMFTGAALVGDRLCYSWIGHRRNLIHGSGGMSRRVGSHGGASGRIAVRWPLPEYGFSRCQTERAGDTLRQHDAALCRAGKSTYSRSAGSGLRQQNFGQFKQARHEKFSYLRASSFGGYECSNPKNEIAAMRLAQRKCCGSLEPHPRPTAGLCLLLCWDRSCCSQ